MELAPKQYCSDQPSVLFAYEPAEPGLEWVQGVDRTLTTRGCRVWRTHSGDETIRCVEQGRLSAVVLTAHRQSIDALALLRIIRSIDVDVPCWLVMENANRWTLEAALSLRATGVIGYPVDGPGLSLALARVIWTSETH
jgi:CheY-like chemotaxis protein